MPLDWAWPEVLSPGSSRGVSVSQYLAVDSGAQEATMTQLPSKAEAITRNSWQPGLGRCLFFSALLYYLTFFKVCEYINLDPF